MQQKQVKKLELKKKTITRLSENQNRQVEGGSIISIIVVTGGCVSAGCATDFTRVTRTIFTGPSGG
jgi:Fe-S cluster assembly iron-binding protein IscA